MKLKVLVMLGSFLVLILLVSISVYAYNAWCSGKYNAKTRSTTLTSGMNAYSLQNGMYVLHVNFHSPQTAANSYANGNTQSRSIAQTASASQSGYGTAYVNGYDNNGAYHADNDAVYK